LEVVDGVMAIRKPSRYIAWPVGDRDDVVPGYGSAVAADAAEIRGSEHLCEVVSVAASRPR